MTIIHPVAAFDTPETARDYLGEIGGLNDTDINIFDASLALALVHRPAVNMDKYRLHMDDMRAELEKTFEKLSAEQNSDAVTVQADALRDVMAKSHGYIGDDVDYNNLQNVDLMRVIDRRLGMPITLSIIGIALCRDMGWQVEGLNFPGHFLMRFDQDGQRLIYDPFQGGKILEAPDLRSILKRNLGDKAELSGHYYEPCSNRDILLRLQNNIKYRLIESGHYQEALEIVDLMTLFAPADYRLKLDLAVLLARLERPLAAMENLQLYINGLSDPKERAEAETFMVELKKMLN